MICNATMGGKAVRRAVLAALLIAASPACSSSPTDTAGPAATVATELPKTTTTTNPYAVPPVIDVAYVNRVLAGLDAVLGDVTRLIVVSRTIPREAYDRMRSVYGTDNWLQLRIDGFQSDIRKNLSGYSQSPGNPITTATELITARRSCIFVRVRRDYTAIGPGATTSSDRNWVGLRPLDPSRDPEGFNVTSWSLTYDGFPSDRSQPPDPCAS